MSAPTCEAVAPLVQGKVCAWCHPGVDATEGHTICEQHKREQLLQLHLALSAGEDTGNHSPKETQTP